MTASDVQAFYRVCWNREKAEKLGVFSLGKNGTWTDGRKQRLAQSREGVCVGWNIPMLLDTRSKKKKKEGTKIPSLQTI
jgi:hypothetical protein